MTHEDFEEGTQRDAFLLIYGYAEHLFEKTEQPDTSTPIYEKSIRFFFCPNPNEINLEDALPCIDNSIRADVLRLRIMFEFWLRDWKIPALPSDAIQVPERILSMATQFGDFVGVDLAREAWFEPGIDRDTLVERVVKQSIFISPQAVEDALHNLCLYFILSESPETGGIYTTGKNPILKLQEILLARGKSRPQEMFHWSDLF